MITPKLYGLTVEVTNICNLHCSICFKRGLEKMKPQHLKLETFKKLLNEANPTNTICFVGLGEPLLNPDFYKILKESDNRHLAINMVTNGVLMDETWCRKIVDLRVSKISISLDAATKETYDKIRLGSDWDKVIKNIKTLVKLRNESVTKYPHIRIDMVMTKQNVHELPLLVKLGKELGVDSVSTLHPQCLLKGLEKEHIIEIDLNDTVDYYKKSILLSKELDIGLKLRPLIINLTKCKSPWLDSYMDVYGDIYPCCLIGCIKSRAIEHFKDVPMNLDFSDMVMGNIHKDNFMDIFNSKKYNDFRNDTLLTFMEQDMANEKTKFTMEDYIKLRKENKVCKNYCNVCGVRFGMVC